MSDILVHLIDKCVKEATTRPRQWQTGGVTSHAINTTVAPNTTRSAPVKAQFRQRSAWPSHHPSHHIPLRVPTMNLLFRSVIAATLAIALASPTAVSAHGSSGFGVNNHRGHSHRHHDRAWRPGRNASIEVCHGRGFRHHCHRFQGNRVSTLGNVRPHTHRFPFPIHRLLGNSGRSRPRDARQSRRW